MWRTSWVVLLLAGLVGCRPTTEQSKRQGTLEYDYVIVGCGAAGLTVASRLSEQTQTTVLCLEAGPLDHYEDEITVPYYIGLQPEGFYDWGITTVPQYQLDGASRHIPMGKGVGGGTLINGMVWNRGNQKSYNSWADLGNEGWAWADLLPYFIRSETFTPRTYPDQEIPSVQFDSSTHGSSGPVQVSDPQYFWEQSRHANLNRRFLVRPMQAPSNTLTLEEDSADQDLDNWFEALESLGIPTASDPNEGLSAGGYFLPLSLNPESQTRSDARRAYYDRSAARDNFNVLTNAVVTRILFENGYQLHATGVEYAQGAEGPRVTINARREVILAAGAIHTPQILELSGIGQASVLNQFGIEVLQDLPGVGNNLQDHGLIHLDYTYTNPFIVSVNTLANNQTFNEEAAREYYSSRTGPWTAKPSQAVAFPSLQQFVADADGMLEGASDNADSYLPSNYESTLRAGYARQLSSIIAELRSDTTPAFENLNNNAGGLDLALMRPLSRGTCHISTTDPFTQPSVDPRWLVNPFDYQVLIAAMQFNQRLLETPSLAVLNPTYVDVPYNANPEQLGDILRSLVGTEYHYSGTAAMLPRNLGGVVDTNLLVYGTDNLRVVDTSVHPIVPGAHLQAVAYAVAEKAADIIKGLSPGPG